jgi:hypothetical protein
LVQLVEWQFLLMLLLLSLEVLAVSRWLLLAGMAFSRRACWISVAACMGMGVTLLSDPSICQSSI